MSYYKNNESNRDALFGSSGGSNNNAPRRTNNTSTTSSSSRKPKNTTIVDFSTYQRKPSEHSTTASTRSAAATGALSSASSISSASLSSISTANSRRSAASSKASSVQRAVTGTAKVTKMKEAEDYRKKAKKAMETGIFSKPDPLTAAAYYRKASELYKQCGENRLERLHRIACADCQRGQESYASAAIEYTRAAELAIMSDEAVNRRRNEAYQLHKSAAEAWVATNNKAKAGLSYVDAASALLIGADEENSAVQIMDRKALTAFEEAAEIHVPDSLNRFASFRQTGKSAYTDTPISLAQEHMVVAPYAHETIFKILTRLLQFNEYSSALYTIGAATKLLEAQDASISLHRAYLTETILQLVLKDVVAADKTFLETHLQKNSYLSSRECKLAEDLIRAVKSMDVTALDTAKLENRSALANLDPTVRLLVMNLRLSGVPKRKAPMKKKISNNMDTIQQQEPPPKKKDNLLEGEELEKSLQDNYSEMDKIMEDMGLDEMDDNDDDEQNQEDDLDDDDIDLR